MAVPCPRCGRQYDITLFQFGRTLHCTCGTRVGIEPRVEPVSGPGGPRFIADAMLGRLARWLRAMGYDTLYAGADSDADVVRAALAQGRILLTRDSALPEEWRIAGVLVLDEAATLAQLRQVVARFGLDWRARPFTRCTRCNTPVEPVAPESVADRVPPRVLRERERFVRCPDCERIYWDGSHTDRMRRVLEQTLG